MPHHPNRKTKRNTKCYTSNVEVLIHPHAYKHGLTDEQILAAFRNGKARAQVRWKDLGSDPLRWATVGYDMRMRRIELLYTMTGNGQALIFHANYVTKAFLKQLRKGTK